MLKLANTLVIGTAQDFHDITHTKALIDAINTGQCFLRVHQPVVATRRIEANIAVAARLLAAFSKVIQQHQAATSLRFGKCAHRVEFVALDILQLPDRLFFEAFTQPRHIGRIVK
ncbi:hypothetical protein D3C75_751780 [compost metagenome]